MAEKIDIFPFTMTKDGATVIYRKNGQLKSRKFAAGTSPEKIKAEIRGEKYAEPDKEEAKRKAEAAKAAEAAARAEKSKAPTTKNDQQIQQEGAAKDGQVKDIAAMKKALIEAKVRGANLMKDEGVKKKYKELFGDKAGE